MGGVQDVRVLPRVVRVHFMGNGLCPDCLQPAQRQAASGHHGRALQASLQRCPCNG